MLNIRFISILISQRNVLTFFSWRVKRLRVTQSDVGEGKPVILEEKWRLFTTVLLRDLYSVIDSYLTAGQGSRSDGHSKPWNKAAFSLSESCVFRSRRVKVQRYCSAETFMSDNDLDTAGCEHVTPIIRLWKHVCVFGKHAHVLSVFVLITGCVLV